MKTNAVRLLDAHGIRHELRHYEVDPEDPAAEAVAARIGMPPEQAVKMLLARGDRNGPCLAAIPGNCELDLKAPARLSSDRKIELVPLKDVQPLTGYIRGGVTVLGAKRQFPVFADKTVELWDVVSVSAGVRGTQVLLAPPDYLGITKATVGTIARPKAPGGQPGLRDDRPYQQAPDPSMSTLSTLPTAARRENVNSTLNFLWHP